MRRIASADLVHDNIKVVDHMRDSNAYSWVNPFGAVYTASNTTPYSSIRFPVSLHQPRSHYALVRTLALFVTREGCQGIAFIIWTDYAEVPGSTQFALRKKDD